MRRIVSCLIVGGLLAGSPGVGISDDRSEPFGPAPESPTRFQQNPDDRSTAERQTYTEVFGRTSGDAVAQPEWAADAAQQGEGEPQPRPRRRGSYTLSRSHHDSAAAATPREPAVVHAEYERDNADRRSGEIEQVSGSDVAPARPAERTRYDRLAQPVATGLETHAPARPEPRTARPPLSDSAPTAPPAAALGPQTPAVSVEWRRASEISVGREFDCELVVRNQGTIAARDMEVTAFIPGDVQLISADPQPSTTEGHLGWTIAQLAAGEERVYAITLLPGKPGEIATHAEVRFTGTADGRFEVAQPMLAISLDGPAEVLIGEAATQIISVTNPGNGVAENVHIEALIPPGLEHVRGSRLLMDIGALHPGEVRNIRLPLAAVSGGVQTVQVQTRADLGLAEVASTDIVVKAPELIASISGPGLRYVGRHATYTLAVTNEGTVASDNVQLMHKVPEGFKLIDASTDVKFDDNLRLVNWHVGSLRSGQTAEVELTFDCNQIGSFTHFVRATSEHGVISDSSIGTDVEGVSVLAMDIQDLEDPVEVGTETVYEISVRNEGSAPASDVSVSCELPAGITLVDVTGPVDYVAERNLIVFRPISTLGPDAESTFRVHVSSAQAGNMRFRARLSSASIEEPLIEEELTRFYGE
jgi:uncharacterized repeat protein (TIGR01451 family)